jgi:hypothetical protein
VAMLPHKGRRWGAAVRWLVVALLSAVRFHHRMPSCDHQRWEVGGGRVTKGGFEVVAVRGGSRCHRTAVHCASADHCDRDAGRCRSAARWRLRR